MNCNDCNYKLDNSDGGFCYMFFNHFKMAPDSGPLDICAKFQYTMNERETRELISSLYEEKEVIMNVVEKIIRMKLPWPSKQNMIVSCVEDLECINEKKLDWLNNGLISRKEYASLEVLSKS